MERLTEVCYLVFLVLLVSLTAPCFSVSATSANVAMGKTVVIIFHSCKANNNMSLFMTEKEISHFAKEGASVRRRRKQPETSDFFSLNHRNVLILEHNDIIKFNIHYTP